MSQNQWFEKYINSMEERLSERLDKIEAKVESLLVDKYKIMGGYIVIAAVMGTLIQFLIARLSR